MSEVNLPTPSLGNPGHITFSTGVKTFVDESGKDGVKLARKLQVSDAGLWVSPNGSDSNDGLSGGSAKATLQAAVNALPAPGGSVNVLGGTISSASGLSWNKDGVSIVGQGANVPILHFTGSAGITVGDGTEVRNGVAFRDLRIRGDATVTPVGLQLRKCWQVSVTNVSFSDFTTQHLLTSEGGGHIRIIGCQASSNSNPVPTFFHIGGGGPVVVVISGCTFEGLGTETCIFLNSAVEDASIVGNAARGTFSRFIGFGNVGRVSIQGNSGSIFSGDAIGGTSGSSDVSIVGNVLKGDATSATSLLKLPSAIRTQVLGNILGNGGSPVVDLNQAIDVQVIGNYIEAARVPGRSIQDNSSTTGVIAHNTLVGDTAPQMAGTGVRWYNNRGLQPQGAASISVGGSPFTYTAGVTPEVVYISGGTVSSIAKNGRTLFASTNNTVFLEPQESVTVTFSSAPTMERDRK